jgi:hypothetical protein
MIVVAIAATLLPAPVRAEAESQPLAQRRVMAFYYPWYGVPDGPGGNGRTVHWGQIDAAGRDIEASTHYPQLGAYDSHDPAVISQHCRWAKAAGVDTFIVSWWGHGAYSDRAMDKILAACLRHGMRACIYYETVPQPRDAETAAADIVRVLEKYGSHRAYLKTGSGPVVFVYGRAINELGLTGWHEAVQQIKADYSGGVTAIGDQFSYGSARVFDGVHTYNTAGKLRDLSPEQVETWSAETFPAWVSLADDARAISTLTIIPGYDDTKIRTPGLAVERYDGRSYRIQWEQAIAADPHWVLITSFNEWHEGSEIEPSFEDGRQYLDITAEYAPRFKAAPRADHTVSILEVISEQEKQTLREALARVPIAVLPNPESTAYWWLLELGVETELLSWRQIVDGAVSPRDYPLLLYCSGEHYRRTARSKGDVDEALGRYLERGGCLVALPSLPWPFYYDENGTAVRQSHRFGLTLRGGWEQPPAGEELSFVQREPLLPHVPQRFDFPTAGDLRWRPFYAGDHVEFVSLLELRNRRGSGLGHGAVYAELPNGGRVAYVWFTLLSGPHAEPILHDLFTFLAHRPAKR